MVTDSNRTYLILIVPLDAVSIAALTEAFEPLRSVFNDFIANVCGLVQQWPDLIGSVERARLAHRLASRAGEDWSVRPWLSKAKVGCAFVGRRVERVARSGC